ncbi:hypothetical protein EFP6CTSP_20665 [Enterococcus faecium]|nr:hypothetical protein EFP6CTSP_20665 [Enterococcus faecium]
MKKEKKLLWICLAILLIIGGIEIFTTYRLKTKSSNHQTGDIFSFVILKERIGFYHPFNIMFVFRIIFLYQIDL